MLHRLHQDQPWLSEILFIFTLDECPVPQKFGQDANIYIDFPLKKLVELSPIFFAIWIQPVFSRCNNNAFNCMPYRVINPFAKFFFSDSHILLH